MATEATVEMATTETMKTEEDIRREIAELERQQREITERLRDPRASLRRMASGIGAGRVGGSGGGGGIGIGGRRVLQRPGLRGSANDSAMDFNNNNDSVDDLHTVGRKRLSSAVVRVGEEDRSEQEGGGRSVEERNGSAGDEEEEVDGATDGSVGKRDRGGDGKHRRERVDGRKFDDESDEDDRVEDSERSSKRQRRAGRAVSGNRSRKKGRGGTSGGGQSDEEPANNPSSNPRADDVPERQQPAAAVDAYRPRRGSQESRGVGGGGDGEFRNPLGRVEVPSAPPRMPPPVMNEPLSAVKRHKRMFGALLGTLEKFKQEDQRFQESERARRRMTAIQRAEAKAAEESERLRQQEREQAAVKRKRDLILKARLAAKVEQKQLELLFLHWTAHRTSLCSFLRTRSEPAVFYMPVKHTEETLKLLEDQKKDVEDWKKTRRAELDEYQSRLADEAVAMVEEREGLRERRGGSAGRAENDADEERSAEILGGARSLSDGFENDDPPSVPTSKARRHTGVGVGGEVEGGEEGEVVKEDESGSGMASDAQRRMLKENGKAAAAIAGGDESAQKGSGDGEGSWERKRRAVAEAVSKPPESAGSSDDDMDDVGLTGVGEEPTELDRMLAGGE
ncbi:hypothetical protein CBR_g5711 [Chara braunii]|uniref:Pinin/SDK/MemA protein domain-containing protein n=1 Tax=Chara braunii TaxID=69332 RepID=A0A388KJ70_CHABU|nr:hypothetical protein CBR_g5711 [Chara braunii]|eukprot:GBG70079.1 hypothetical protein CBR_g5711 [Chara braunii]